MRGGKKSIAERIVYDALESIGEKTEDDPMKVFKRALENVKPAVEVKSRRVGGATYQVPIEVRPERRTALAMRWLIQMRREPRREDDERRLAGELIDAAEQPRRGGQEERRHAPDGGGQQGLRALSLVAEEFRDRGDRRRPQRELPSGR